MENCGKTALWESRQLWERWEWELWERMEKWGKQGNMREWQVEEEKRIEGRDGNCGIKQL